MRRSLLFLAALTLASCSGGSGGSSSSSTSTTTTNTTTNNNTTTNTSSTTTGGTGTTSNTTSTSNTSNTNGSNGANASNSTTTTTTSSSSSSNGTSGPGTTTSNTSGTTTGTHSTTSGSSSSSSSGTTGSGYAAYCQQEILDECQYLQRCNYVDPSISCTALANTLGDCSMSTSEFNFNASLAATCIGPYDDLANTSCNDSTYYIFDAGAGVDCTQVLTPAVPEGGQCSTAGSCLPRPDGGQLQCAFASGTCVGTCQLGPLIGDPCPDYFCSEGTCQYQYTSFSDGGYTYSEICENYLAPGAECDRVGTCDPSIDYCDYSTNPATCQTLPGPGQACNYYCQAGLTCISPDGGFNNTCQSPKGLNESCTSTSDCQTDLICVSGTCQQEYVPINQPCWPNETRCENSYCNSADGGQGICSSFLSVGTACDPSVEQECGVFAQCTNNVCKYEARLGDSCTQSSDCRFGLYCGSDSFCHDIGLSVGQSCDPAVSGSCESLRCDPGTSKCVNFKAPGAVCDPNRQDCSPSQSCSYFVDGGYACSDYYCQAADGGGLYSDGGSIFSCATYCP